MRYLKIATAILVLATSLLGVNTAVAAGAAVKPINKLKPVYPRRAMQRNIEGFVKVQFNVDATGAVTDAQVVEAKPAKIFDKSALKAVRKLKYPKGSPASDVKLKLDYKLS